MAIKIKHKRSSVAGKVPLAADLETGELALNSNDGKVYLKKDNDEILDITKQIFINDTSVSVADTGTDGTITMVVDGTTVATVTDNQVSITQNTTIENAKELQFKELTDNGINYVGIKSPDDLANSYNLSLPTATGTLNQLLKTNGSGQLGWSDVDTFGSNRIYVSATKGDDANDGVTAPVLTIKRALQLASGYVYTSGGLVNGTRINVIVSAGDYVENNPIIVPDNVTVKGDSLRSVNIRPLNANKDMLRVRNGCYFGEMTFRDGLSAGVPSYTFAYAVAFDDYTDPGCDRTGYTYLPSTKPVISQSPYVQNCTLLSFLGASGVLVDGSLVVTPNTPANQIEAENPVSGPAPEQGKSMVANAFTMLSFGGTGWRVINDAYVQIVSCFQIFMLNGTYTQSGGYCSITNSATNFGLYALRASGFSPNAFAFDKGYIGTTGTSGSVQTITAFGWTRVNGPVEEFVIQFYDPSTTTNLTSSYKAPLVNYLQVAFNAATDIDIGTETFTVVSHGLFNQDTVVYDSNSGTLLGGLYDGDTLYVKKLTNDTFQLYYDNSLTRQVDITTVGSGTQYFTRQDYELYVSEVTETHNTFQDIVLDTGGTGGYSFVIGDLVEGITGGNPSKGYVQAYEPSTRTLTLCINKVVIGLTETRNLFAAGSSISLVAGSSVAYTVSSAASRTDLYGADFKIASTILNGALTNTATLPGKQIWFHRPSVTNSSAHTWEYAGSGTDYNALPQNGGKGVPSYEQVSENAGRVYTSGTNELGDFKVGAFVTAFNRTGNVTFTNKVTVDTLDVLKLGVGGVVIEEISTDVELGNSEPGGPKNTRLSTQLANYTYFQNHLGNVLDKSVSTNAVPGSLVQLNANGQINSDLIPTSRSFTSWNTNGLDSRLYQVDNIPASDILAGDIGTENFYQQELTLASSATVTAPIGAVVLQTTGNTATTAITSGTNTFTVTHSAGVTLVNNTYVLIEGATPTAYNGLWKINRAAAGTFTVFTNINPGTATVQGTIYYGGACGITKADYVAANKIIVGSVDANFNTPFTASANTLIIGTDRTPSDANGAVNPSDVTSPASATSNHFLRTSTSGQFLVIENTASPVYTNGTISKAFRYNNNAYITSTLAHNFLTNNEVKVNAATVSYSSTKEITVTSTTEFYYDNTAADSSTSASTTATATLAGAVGATTMTGSVTSAALTGTISLGDFVFDVAGTIPLGSKITTVNMAVNPRTFTITFPASSTVAATSSAQLKFFTPASETGTIQSVVTAADNGAQGSFVELRSGIITSVNNLSGLTGGTLYTNGVYYGVPLTNVTGSGVGALANITVSAGQVTDVDVTFGGAGYVSGSALSATSVVGGFGNGTGSGFQILINAVEKRVYLTIAGGELFVATGGAPDFVEHNTSSQLQAVLTDTVSATFNAAATGSGGGVDTLLNRITTLAAHGFTTGDPLKYNSGSDPAIGGLINLNVYYAKVIDSTTIELYNNYSLDSIQVLSSGTGSGHTFTRSTIDIVDNTVTVPAHGFITGDAFRIKGSDLPYIDAVQITSGRHFFVGSVTTNSFTLHDLRSDALDSIAGVTIGAANLTAVGTGSATLIKNDIKVTSVVNTSSAVSDNWNSLVATTIDASNIVSGIIATSRLATGSANSSTFLRGDSTWSTVVQSAAIASGSVLSITGSGSSPYHGALTFDVAKVNSTGGSGGYSTIGVASFNTTQFSVGTGSSLGDSQVLVKDGVIDAGTLQTKNLAYVLDSANHTTQPVSVGGTGLTLYTQGDLLYASAGTTLNKLNIGVNGTILTSTGTAPQWSSTLVVAEDVSLNGADIITTSTAASSLFNTNTKAVNIGAQATSIAIGSSTANEAFTTNVKSYTTSGTSSVSVTAIIGQAVTISTVARNTNIAVITTTTNHGLTNGDVVTIVCTSDTGFNTVQASVAVTNNTIFAYANTGADVTPTSGSGSVYIGAVGIRLGTAAVSSNTFLAFATSPITAGVRAGMLVQGSANIPAGARVTGLDANRVYLSAALTGTITSTSPIAFTDTNTSMGIKVGDQITVASSGVTALNGTWPVTSAGAASTAFTFKISTAITQTNLARVGTIVKESTLVIRNRNVTIGSSEASTSPVSAVLKAENAVGTNIAGADITIQGGANTGNNTAGGNIIFKTPTQGSTGDVTQTLTERMRVQMSGGATTLDLTTTMATANVFDTNATTVNFAGAATTLALANSSTGAKTINIGTASTGTTTVNIGGAVTGNAVEINSVAAGVVTLRSDVTTGTVNLFTGTTTGTINIGTTGASGSTVKTGATTVVNDQLHITSSETTGISGTVTAVSSFATATFRSAKFTVQVECTAGTDAGQYQISEILMLQDGTTATLTDYAVIRSGNNLVTFTADISAPNARLLATATAGNTIKVRVVRYLNTI